MGTTFRASRHGRRGVAIFPKGSHSWIDWLLNAVLATVLVAPLLVSIFRLID